MWFRLFLIYWGIILFLNQLFLFHACFSLNCLIAALPHTGIISAILTYYIVSAINKEPYTHTFQNYYEKNPKFCKKCGSKMIYDEKNPLSYTTLKCSKYPQCDYTLGV